MSAAVLFYGYSLGAPDDTGWAFIKRQGDALEFDWEIQAEIGGDGEYEPWMRQAILMTSGLSEEEIPLHDSDDLLAKVCGVRILTFGHSNTQFYGIALADTIQRAEDWSPKTVSPTGALNSHDLLSKALTALGVKPRQANPSWILAPSEF